MPDKPNADPRRTRTGAGADSLTDRDPTLAAGWDRRRAAALRLPPIDDYGTRDPLLPRRRQGGSLTESVDELRSIVLRELFPELNELRARVAFLESVVLGDQAGDGGAL
jgi:hypothetical protein